MKSTASQQICRAFASAAASAGASPKRQLSDMDPITMMMANAGLGIRSPESDAYLRAAFDRGIVNQQSHRNAAAVASQVGTRVWKG